MLEGREFRQMFIADLGHDEPTILLTVHDDEVVVRFHRWAHLPIVLASGLLNSPVTGPWWGGRPLRFAA